MQQELLQFRAEILRAGRKVESQGRQGIDDPVAAHVATVDRLHTNDGDDDFFRHPVFLGGLPERLCVAFAESGACLDARGGEKAGAIGLPGARQGLGRRSHRADDRRLMTGLGKQGDQFAACKAMLRNHFVDEATDIISTGVSLPECGRPGTKKKQRKDSQRPHQGLNPLTS